MSGPLSHLKILDLSRILAGPWATQMLGDMGADVLKIERPGAGDDTRHWGPPFLKGKDGGKGDAAYFLAANRNKASLEIDITTSEGQARVRTLAKDADVLVENFKVGGLARYGLDYDSLKGLNPRLIYCSITGFGQTGPYATRPGYDLLVQAMGGLMSITGQPDSVPGGGPVKVGVAVADIMTGMYATAAILAAVAERERSGQGQHIDLALLDCQVAMLANQAMNYLVTGRPPGRLGNGHPNIVPYEVFETVDGHVVVAVGNDTQFQRFTAVAGADWADDDRFSTNAARVVHRDVLCPMIAEVLRRKETAHWIERLEKVSIPCGPVNDIAAALRDPQVVHRGLVQPHERGGEEIRTVANPIVFSRTPLTADQPPPSLGAATRKGWREHD